jgi:hypothetical protein
LSYSSSDVRLWNFPKLEMSTRKAHTVTFAPCQVQVSNYKYWLYEFKVKDARFVLFEVAVAEKMSGAAMYELVSLA